MRRTVPIAVLACAAAALTACLPPNGEEKKPPQTVVMDAIAALEGTSSAHVIGIENDLGVVNALDCVTQGSDRAAGTMSGQVSVQFVEMPDTGYLKAGNVFWFFSAGVNLTDADKLANRWVKFVGQGPSSGQGYGMTTDEISHQFFQDFVPPTGKTRTVFGGRPAIAVFGRMGATAYIANTGPAYPLTVAAPLASLLSFTDFNKPGVDITAPPGAKTMAEILGHSTDNAGAKAASIVAKAAPLAR